MPAVLSLQSLAAAWSKGIDVHSWVRKLRPGRELTDPVFQSEGVEGLGPEVRAEHCLGRGQRMAGAVGRAQPVHVPASGRCGLPSEPLLAPARQQARSRVRVRQGGLQARNQCPLCWLHLPMHGHHPQPGSHWAARWRRGSQSTPPTHQKRLRPLLLGWFWPCLLTGPHCALTG